jgi:phosphatidylglycerophosphate synthase
MMPSRSSLWITWANLLTALRLVLVIPSALAILAQAWWWGAFLFTLAVASDFLDGYAARRFNQASPLGGLLDHVTDAIYVTAGCWALAQLDLINPYLPWLIAAAFAQYALDSKVLVGRMLRASRIGKNNGVAYFVVVGVGIGAMALDVPELLAPLAWFAWALVITTVISMLDRALALMRKAHP